MSFSSLPFPHPQFYINRLMSHINFLMGYFYLFGFCYSHPHFLNNFPSLERVRRLVLAPQPDLLVLLGPYAGAVSCSAERQGCPGANGSQLARQWNWALAKHEV